MKNRILSSVLAVVLIISSLPMNIFSESDSTFHYVAIGDSMTNGFGFDGYYRNGVDVKGFGQVAPEAYPALITEMLKAEGKDVALHQFAGSALRPEDLDAILDPDHIDDDYTSRVFTGHDRGTGTAGEEWFKIWGKLIDDGVDDCESGEVALRQEFYSAITDADLITYHLGNNNFGAFVTGAITDNRHGDSDSLQDLLTGLGISKEEIDVSAIREKLMGLLSGAPGEDSDIVDPDGQIVSIIDTFVQGYVGAMAYFTKNMEIIRQINPDCEIVVVGLRNYADFLKVELGGKEIDAGAFYGMIVELANVYMGSLCKLSTDYYYADLMEADISTFGDELISGKLGDALQGYLDGMIGGIAKGVAPVLEAYPDKTVGMMLRGWNENGFTDNDYELLAEFAKGMGLVDDETTSMLQGLGLTLPKALKTAYLYHTGSDEFVPMLDGMLDGMAESQSGVSTLRSLLKGQGGNYISFQTLKMYLSLAGILGLTGDINSYLTMLDDVGKQLDTFKNYGRVQEILLDCITKDTVNLDEVLGALSGEISMDAIGSEIISALETGTELSASTKALINFYFMFIFPDGMAIGVHPNADGHLTMANVIYNAYKNKTVAKDYMDVKMFSDIADLVDLLLSLKDDTSVDSYSDFSLKDTRVTSYTSLGDSTVFGFGLQDFAVGSEIFEKTYGYGVCSEYAYPQLLAESLGIEDGNFRQLSMGSLRVDDILSILNLDKTGDWYYTECILKYLDLHAGGVEKAHNDYIDAIKNSDLISIAMGGNNVSTFIGEQIKLLEAREDPVEFDWEKYSGSKLIAIKDTAEEIFGMIKENNPDARVDDLQAIAESAVYGCIGVLENFSLVLDKIHELNPDAKIIFVGLFNPADEIYYQKDGSDAKIKIGKIIDIIMESANTAFREYAVENSEYCCFVNVEDAEMFMDNDEAAVLNAADSECLPYIRNNHGAAGHPTENGHEYMFRQIQKALGLIPVNCVSTKTVSLSSSGKYGFELNGYDFGEYEFTKTANGYRISKDGVYLTFTNNTVSTTGSESRAYEWRYGGNRFYAATTGWQSRTYYLTADVNGFTLTSQNIPANVILTETVVKQEHSFSAWTPCETEDGKHMRTCADCGYTEYGKCKYGEDHKCGKCGRDGPEFTHLLGDCNGDGLVDTADATAILKYVIGVGTVVEANSDCNGDGLVDTADATAILKYLIGEYVFPKQ